MQGDFGRQTSLEASQVVCPFMSQTKGIEEFVIDRFNDLSQTSKPTAQGFGPSLLATLMRWGDHASRTLRLPLVLWLISCKPLISHIEALCRQAAASQTWARLGSCSNKSRGQRLIMSAGWSEAKPSDYSGRVDTEQQMEPFVPTQTGTPTNISLSSQPVPRRLASRVLIPVLSSTAYGQRWACIV